MEIYLVGGAIRDQLLHRPIKERDWVVVGAKPEALLALGFRPVGKAFPVFLHPKTGEEYALARTERKVGTGYYGFECDVAPDVTLVQDLKRRDLTINAMARSKQGTIIDPYGGQADIKARRLRHVSPAFVEDPLRVLRVARFAGRYASLGFQVASETMRLMQSIVASGELGHLVADRVWQEFSRALSEPNPEVFIKVLEQCQAWLMLFPELELPEQPWQLFTQIVKNSTSLPVRFASLVLQGLKDSHGFNDFCNRYPVPRAYKSLAALVVNHHQCYQSSLSLKPETILALFAKVDAYRRLDRFKDFLLICEIQASSEVHLKSVLQPSHFFLALLDCVKQVKVQALIASGIQGEALRVALDAQRLKYIQQFLASRSQRLEPD